MKKIVVLICFGLCTYFISFSQCTIADYSIVVNDDHYDIELKFMKAKNWKWPSINCEYFLGTEQSWWLYDYKSTKRIEFPKNSKNIHVTKFQATIRNTQDMELKIDTSSPPNKWLKRNYSDKYIEDEKFVFAIDEPRTLNLLRVSKFSEYKETTIEDEYSVSKKVKILEEKEKYNVDGSIIDNRWSIELPIIKSSYDIKRIYNDAFPFISIELIVVNASTGLISNDFKITILEIEGVIWEEQMEELIEARRNYDWGTNESVNPINHPYKEYFKEAISRLNSFKHTPPKSYLKCLKKKNFPYKIDYSKTFTAGNTNFYTKTAEGGLAYHIRPHPDSKELYLKLLIEKVGYDPYVKQLRVPLTKVEQPDGLMKIERFTTKYKVLIDQNRSKSRVIKLL